MHEFSRHIFCWIAFFAFITFDYRYKFNSRLSYNIQQISRTTYVLTFRVQISNAFGSRGNTLSLSINFACSRYHHLPSPFPGKQLKAITTAQIWKINWTVPCIFTAAYICHKLESTCIFCHITCVTIYQMGNTQRRRDHSWPTLTSSDYWPLWGCTVDRIEMAFKCIVGLFLEGTHFQHGSKFVPQNSPTMHSKAISTRSTTQPQSGE